MEQRDWLLLVLFAVRDRPESLDADGARQGLALVSEGADASAEQVEAGVTRLIAEGLARPRPADAAEAGLEVTELGVERATTLMQAAAGAAPAAVEWLYVAKRDGLASARADQLASRAKLPSRRRAGLNPARLVRPLRRLLGRFLFERRLDTAEPTVDVHHFHPERVRYRPTEWMLLRRTLDALDVGAGDVLVDFGSGKGRVLYEAAARFELERVVGIEISPELSNSARENLERYRNRLRCRNFELITSDFVDYQIPDDMTIAFFYLPVTGALFRQTLGNIIASLDRNPRRLRIAYIYPLNHPDGAIGEDAIRDTGRFDQAPEVLRRGRDKRGNRAAIYVSRPAA